MGKIVALSLLVAATIWVHVKGDMSGASQDKPGAQLVEENEHYRVWRFDLAGESQAAVPRHAGDFIIVALGDGLSLSSAKGADPEKLADGDVRFFKPTVYPTIFHSGDETSQAIVVELKQHWDAEILPCAEPRTCTHTIRAGGLRHWTKHFSLYQRLRHCLFASNGSWGNAQYFVLFLEGKRSSLTDCAR
jgi:hypothetical protein